MRMRGFTMIEVATVMVVVGLCASMVGIGVSTAIENARKGEKLQSIYTALQQIRAQHLSASASPTSCLFMKDVGGALEVEEREDCNTKTTPALHRFNGSVLLRNGTGCVDNLARAVKCSDGCSLSGLTFDVDVDGKPGADGTISWAGSGRLTASFSVDASAGSDVQAHLQDASSVTTPAPTAVGSFAGTTTNPRGLLE